MGNSIGEPIIDENEYTRVLKYDVMMKRAQGRNNKHLKNYRARLFTLTSKALLYYDGISLQNRGDLKGIVILRNIIKIETVNEVVLKKQNCFVLEHLGLSLFIVAKSVEQRNSWIEAIESLLEEITPHPIRDLVTFQSCPVISNVNGRNEESKDSHIWVKKYASFEESHPLQKNRTIFQRFNLSISISNFPKTPYVQIGTDLVMLELDAVVRIFSYLTLRDVANIRCVCKRWRHLTEVTDLWNEVSVNKMKVLCVKSMTDVYGSYVQKLELKSIEGDITSSLFSASLLTHLRLEYTQVNLAVLPKFLVNLTLLKLRYCAIVEGIHGTLKDVTEIKFEKLKYLTFHFNENYDNLQISNLLAMSPGLLKLDLSGTVIIDSSVFKDIPFLQELRMEYVKLDGAMLAINCPNLQKLSLIWSDFVGPSRGVLARLSTLYITYQHTCVYETLLKMFRSTPQLKTLSLTGLLDMTVTMFNRLVPYFQNVTTLILKRCTLLNNDCMVQIANYCHALEDLDISDLVDISGDGIIHLLLSAVNLKRLDLSCTKTDDKVFELLVNRVVKLEKLGISACPFIQDESMRILSNLSSLKHLDISECKYVTPQGLYSFSHHPKVRLINALKCQSIEKQEIILNLFNPHCHIMY